MNSYSDKQSYYRTIVVLGSVVLLLAVWIAVLIMNPKIIIQEIEVPKEVVVEKTIEVEKEVIVEKEPTHTYNITSEEREMLARLVYREANIESFECQKAVASVVINRWQNGKWGGTLKEVVYSENQFSPSGLIYKTTPTEINYQAVDYVLKNGSILPKYVLYFRASYGFSDSWSGYKEYKQISDTYFGYFEKDKKN